MKAVIFDIDGTLADLTHRLHYVSGQHKDWDAFFDKTCDDEPHDETIGLANILAEAGKSILLVSGRPEKTRLATINWMENYGVQYHQLYMRPDGDFRPDYIIKSQILDGILADGYEIDFVVDDRQSVVDMWRERGIVCLQCRSWNDREVTKRGLLSLMVGPSGAGKSTWLRSEKAKGYGIDASHIISSDQIRQDLCGDFRDQSKNEEVFSALHAVAKARIDAGLPTVIDATNLRRKDRLSCVALASGSDVRYFVIDRPMDDKKRDGGWRNELPFDLLAKHDQTFKSQLSDILIGDKQDNVKFVFDLREMK